jgi:hypothetical protein
MLTVRYVMFRVDFGCYGRRCVVIVYWKSVVLFSKFQLVGNHNNKLFGIPQKRETIRTFGEGGRKKSKHIQGIHNHIATT